MTKLVSLYTGSPVALLAGSGAIALLASGVMVWSHSERWFGVLPTTLSLSTLPLILTPMICGGLGAFLAGQQRRWGAAEWLAVSSASPRRLLRPALISVLALAIGTHLILVVAMVVASLLRGADVSLVPSHLLLVVPAGCAYAATWAALGVLLGRMVRQEIALPLAAISPYLAYFLMLYFIESSRLGGIVIIDQRSWLEFIPTLPMLAAQLAFWSAAAATLSALALRARGVAQLPALGMLIALGALIVVGPAVEERSVPDEEVCVGSSPEVCVPHSHETVLEEYHAATRDTLERVPEALWPDRVVSESPVHGGTEPGTVVAPPLSGNTSQALRIDEERFAVELGEALLLRCILVVGAEEWSEVIGDLEEWWRTWWRLDVDLDPSEQHWAGDWTAEEGVIRAVEGFRSEPAAVQEQWWERTAQAIAECELESIELP